MVLSGLATHAHSSRVRLEAARLLCVEFSRAFPHLAIRALPLLVGHRLLRGEETDDGVMAAMLNMLPFLGQADPACADAVWNVLRGVDGTATYNGRSVVGATPQVKQRWEDDQRSRNFFLVPSLRPTMLVVLATLWTQEWRGTEDVMFKLLEKLLAEALQIIAQAQAQGESSSTSSLFPSSPSSTSSFSHPVAISPYASVLDLRLAVAVSCKIVARHSAGHGLLLISNNTLNKYVQV